MPGQQPAGESVELFNRLVSASPDDSTLIKSIQWRLRVLARQPRNHVARVAAIRAHILLGESEEALRQADEVWGRRQGLDRQVADAFAAHLASLGLHQRFLAFDGEWLLLDDPLARSSLRRLAYWQSGDLEAVRRTSLSPAWTHFFDDPRLDRFIPHFAAHQRIINAHMVGWQVGMVLMLLDDAEDTGDWDTPVTFLYGPGDYARRAALSDSISSDLRAYYEASGLAHTDWSTRFAPVLLPHTALPEQIDELAAA